MVLTRFNMKYEQMTLTGIFEERKEQQHVKESVKEYVSPCGGCICDKCANNVECLRVEIGEQIEPCFNCDYCVNYDGKGEYNKKYECSRFVITNHEAKKARERFKILARPI